MQNRGERIKFPKSKLVTGEGSESHPFRNSPCERPHHFCSKINFEDLDNDLITFAFVARTAPFTSSSLIVEVVSFIGRVEVNGISPTIGIHWAKS